MAIKLNDKDHTNLDQFLGHVLDLHSSGDVTKNDAIGALAHVFTAAAIDNESEVKSWLERPEVINQWKKDIQANS
jgi:hypothetical protein